MPTASLLQDLRYTVRTLRRDTGFAVFAILIAGLGIGASATVFSVVNTLLLRPLPFARPSELVWIANRDAPGLSGQTTQVGYLLDLREKTQTMSAVAGYFAFYGVGDNLLSGRGEPERLSGVPVSDNFFDVLGVKPLLGRSFNAQESAWKGPKAVMLGHAVWERRFGRDSRIVGSSIDINDEPHTVVGVLPASFDFASVFAPGQRFDLFFPFPLSPETNRWGNTMAMIGRLKPGVTAARAHAEVTTLAPQMRREHPGAQRFHRPRPAPCRLRQRQHQARGDGPGRRRGDGHADRLRQPVEPAAGADGGATQGNRHPHVAGRRTRAAARPDADRGSRARLGRRNPRPGAGVRRYAAAHAAGCRQHPAAPRRAPGRAALAFTVAVTLITGIVFGLAPTLHASGAGMGRALKDATRGSTEGRERTWVRNALVVSEIAFACVLLVGAGLLIRSLAAVLEVNMGFRAGAQCDDSRRSRWPHHDVRAAPAYLADVLRRVGEAPGIEHAAITDSLPLGRNRTWGAGAKGVTYEKGAYPLAFVRVVSEGYPAAMGVPVLAGRDLTATDGPGAEPVMLVNKSLADALWPGQNPIGQVHHQLVRRQGSPRGRRRR